MTKRSPAGMSFYAIIVSGALLTMEHAWPQTTAPVGTDLATFAARRHPQPVRVGDLINRNVLQPVESRRILGRVKKVVRLSDNSTAIVITYGGILGFGTREIAVPVDAMVLLGSELEVLDFTPAQLDAFASFDGNPAAALAANEMIHMGLAHPSH